eukprot:6270398-Alexandrium_andersonii.AAC.1
MSRVTFGQISADVLDQYPSLHRCPTERAELLRSAPPISQNSKAVEPADWPMGKEGLEGARSLAKASYWPGHKECLT